MFHHFPCIPAQLEAVEATMKVTMSPSPLFSKINQLIKMATIKDYYGVTHITMHPAKI